MRHSPLVSIASNLPRGQGAGALDHLLAAQIAIQDVEFSGLLTIADVLKRAWIERLGRGGTFTEALGSIGLRVVDDRGYAVLLVDPTRGDIDQIFEGTRWAGIAPAILLRSVPGAPRTLTTNKWRIGGCSVRAQAVPMGLGTGV